MTTAAIKPTPRTVPAPTHSQSVMRQTQALIGTVILASAAAAYFVNIAFVGVAAFMGCGLLLAAVRGNCPMASVIATMPWNRGVSCGCTAETCPR